MAEQRKDIGFKNSAYRLRMLLSVVLIELLLLGVFTYWPIDAERNAAGQDLTFREDIIYLEDAIITRQESSPPPPPRPQSPIPVPNDEIIEEEITLEAVDISEFGDSLSKGEMSGEEGGSALVENPDSSPTVRHIVEPSTPEAAKKAGVRARIWVRFIIDQEGQVENATIAKIERYSEESGEYQTVKEINYKIPEVVIEAAMQWRFRPARNNDQPVRSTSRQVFTFGL